MYGLSIAFFFATYVIFLTGAGLDLFEVNLINAIFMITNFLMEVPTGIVADVYGRKRSLVLSCFVTSLALFVYFISDSFWFFALAEVVAAIGHSLCSGAFKAWMVDEVNATSEGFDIRRAYRAGKFSDCSGILIGGVVGGYIGQTNIALPWLASSVLLFVTGIVAILIMKELAWQKKEENERSYKLMFKTLKFGISLCKTSPALVFVMSLGFVWGFALMPFNMYWQPRFKVFGLEVYQLGWMYFGIVLMVMLGAVLSAYVFQVFKSNKRSIFFTFCLLAFGMLMSAWANTLSFGLIMFYIHEIARGMYEPLLDDYLNKRIESGVRATILSFYSMLTTFGAFWGLLVSGQIAKHYSIESAWTFSGIIVILFVLFFILKGVKNEKKIFFKEGIRKRVQKS